jgi:hypothetical protein
MFIGTGQARVIGAATFKSKSLSYKKKQWRPPTTRLINPTCLHVTRDDMIINGSEITGLASLNDISPRGTPRISCAPPHLTRGIII